MLAVDGVEYIIRRMQGMAHDTDCFILDMNQVSGLAESAAQMLHEVRRALAAVDELRALVPAGATMAEFALRWILMEQAVTVVIPGAKTPDQARANTRADALAPLSEETLGAARAVYDRLVAPHVHHLW